MTLKIDRRFQSLVSISTLVIAMSFITLSANLFLATLLPPLVSAPLPVSQNSEDVLVSLDDNGILHIVTTRFMQNQPNLVELGQARLELFRTFCLPTIIHQNTEKFLWFVMTDPKLDETLLSQLKSLLSPYPNFYLVASNSKLLTPANLTSSATTDFILTGDVDLLYTQMFDIYRPLLIETRLDADDGLEKSTLAEVQRLAQELPIDTKGWQIICSRIHFEWRNDEIISSNRTIDSSGKLRLVRESICVTPGYTFVKHRGPQSIDFPSWPRIQHHVVTRDWPECKISNHGNATRDCWTKLGQFPSALRSRTVTSAGMSRIQSKAEDHKYENATEMLWEMVQQNFRILPSDALETSRYLKSNLKKIALDNLQGQW